MERVLVQYPNQARSGPHTWDELRQLALTGQLPQDATLIDDRTGERRIARDVPELFAPARTSAAATAIPPAAAPAKSSNKNILIVVALVVLLGLCVLCAVGGLGGMFYARERSAAPNSR